MQRLLILGSLGLAAATLGVTTFNDVETRLARLDRMRREAPQQLIRVESGLADLAAQLEELRGALEDVEALGSQTGVLQNQLGQLGDTISQQRSTLAQLEAQVATYSPESLEGLRQEIEADLDERWDGLTETVTAAAQLAEETHEQIDRLAGDKDTTHRWRAIVAPTVQLAGQSTVGSGVLLQSRSIGDGEYETLMLTAWHVVRDIRADSLEQEPLIPVTIYMEGGGVEFEDAELLIHDADLDAALLKLTTTEKITFGARLPNAPQLDGVKIFQPIYAVGCPLGNDPIPTAGEIADTHHVVDGATYWMISAPTYIGNSGGGIYDAETHALLGIFSKIYTHGSLSPTVVPHMGLVTPMPHIYEWLRDEGYELAGLGDQIALVK